MKKIFAITVLGLLCSCEAGADDKKNEVENYPTYDTTNTPHHINDSTSGRNMQSEGELRHNIDSDGDENR